MSESTVTAKATPASDRYRWVILFVCTLSFFMSFVDRLAWSNLSLTVGEALNLPLSTLGVFTTSFYIGYVLFNALGGLLSDRVGAKAILILSVNGLGILTFIFGFTQSMGAGLVTMFLMGLTAGADYACCIKLIVAWFEKSSRGKAIGLFMIASSLAVTITNLAIPPLAQLIGWQAVYQLLGASTLGVGILSFFLIRETPDNDPAPATKTTLAAVLPLLRDRNLVFLTLAGFGAFWGTWGFAFWSSTLLIKHEGMSAVEAGFIVSLTGMAAIVGKPVIGYLSDLTGNPRLLAIGTLLLFAFMLLLFGNLHGRTAFIIAAPILGIGAFVYSPLLGVMVAEVAGPHRAGSATGFTAAIWQLGSALVPIAVGGVFQATQSFNAAFITLAIGPVLGALALCFVRLRPARQP
jgi:sugar phosphate permease